MTPKNAFRGRPMPCENCDFLRAQVAIGLMAGVEWTLKRLTKREDWPMSWEAKFPGLKAQAILDLGSQIPTKARALLDRLQRAEDERASLAEDCGEMRKQITRQLVQLQRAEAVVEAVKQYRDRFTALNVVGSDGVKDIAGVPRDVHDVLLKALAAWEEGK